MGVIDPSDLDGTENLALRILGVARTIAPCLDSLEGTDKDTAIAILIGVMKEARTRGSRQIKAQRVGPASVDYIAGSWFSDDDRAALRGLCGASTPGGTPIGRFPKPNSPINRLWPEDCDTY